MNDIPEWMKITEAKAVIEANGQNIYFASLEDAKKVYAFALNAYKKRHRTLDFKKPRRFKVAEKEALFITVEEPKKQVVFEAVKTP